MPIKVNGTTSGSVTLTAPATGSDVTLTLPGSTGTVQTVPGAWTDWTPTISSSSGSITSSSVTSAKYTQIGKLVVARFDFTISNNGTGAGVLRVTLPVTAATGSYAGFGGAREITSTGNLIAVFSDTTTTMSLLTYNNAYPGGTNYRIVGLFTYEAA